MPTSRTAPLCTKYSSNPGRAGIRSSLLKGAAVVFLSPVENPLPGQNGRDASGNGGWGMHSKNGLL